MEKELVKIGDLSFQLIIPDDEEEVPVFEIENEASIIFESLDVVHAIQLRDLLEAYIEVMRDS